MEKVFFEVLNRSISASWFVLAILLIRLLICKFPRWTHCSLWGLVAIRLLSPYSIKSVLSLIPSSETISPNIVYARSPAIHTGITMVNSSINPILADSFSPAPMASVNPLQIVSFIAQYVWIAGIAVMLLYALCGFWTIKRNVRTAVHQNDRIYVCDDISCPFILGIICPKIYLPSSLSAETTAHVLAHEYAHLKRKDHWWKPVGFLLLSIHWFNPLMWIAYILLCRDIEIACDERVVKELPLQDRKDYSCALLECSVHSSIIRVCPLAFGEVGIKHRIKNILRYKRTALWITVAAIIIFAAASILFLTDPKASSNKLPSPFGKEYIVSEIVYDAPQYSFTYTSETAPHYRLNADLSLEILEDTNSQNWLTPGVFRSHDLSVGDFASTIFEASSPISSASLVENNVNAWSIDVLETDNGTFYYLLQQKDGTLYFCLGYRREVFDTIRWIFQLEEAEHASGIEEASDEQYGLPQNKEDLLETTIHQAIMNHGRSKYTDSIFPCESHIILDEETIIACGTDDSNSYSQTTFYLMVLYQEYDLSDGVIKDMGGSHMPVALTIKNTEDSYEVLEYWTPKDGSYYQQSIQEKFPKKCWDLTDTQIHILRQIQSCYDQTIQANELDTVTILNDLYDEIEKSPAISSSPGDYINANPTAYREITYYGMYALQHAFGEFLKGGQTDLRGYLMALACQEVLESIGEPFKPGKFTTGQEWFEQFRNYAYSLKPEITSPYSSQFRPAIRLLLNMA